MNASILIIDDDLTFRDGAAFRLMRAGHQVQLAGSVREALQHFAQLRPDLVLLDIGLPDGDGFDLGRRLLSANIPFIFITARSALRDRVHGLEIGADDYLTKPFGLDELTARVNAVLRRVRLLKLSDSEGNPKQDLTYT